MILDVGLRIKFQEEKQAYTVMASNWRYAVCTKPFNAQKTVIYTVVDFEEWIRGTENLIFGAGAETKKACQEMLARLSTDDDPTEVSRRNQIDLRIEAIYKPRSKNA